MEVLGTRDQADSELWHEMRKGRVTGSSAYQFISRARKRKAPTQNLYDKLEGKEKDLSQIPAIIYGKRMEKTALDKLEMKMRQEHQDMEMYRPGLFLSRQFDILGSSPDAM